MVYSFPDCAARKCWNRRRIMNLSNQLSGIAAPIVTGFVVAATKNFQWAFLVAAIYLAIGLQATFFCSAKSRRSQNPKKRGNKTRWKAHQVVFLNARMAPVENTAVDEKSLAGDVAARFGCEKNNRSVEIVRLAGRFSGILSTRYLTHSLSSYMTLFCAVRNHPGARQFTVIPCFPQSSARLMVSWRIPPRLAPYGPRPA